GCCLIYIIVQKGVVGPELQFIIISISESGAGKFLLPGHTPVQLNIMTLIGGYSFKLIQVGVVTELIIVILHLGFPVSRSSLQVFGDGAVEWVYLLFGGSPNWSFIHHGLSLHLGLSRLR